MSIRDYKITDAQFSEKGVIAAPDTLTGTAAENKGVFDRFAREIIAPQFNAIVDEFADMEESANSWAAEEAQRVQQENARQSAEQGRVSAEGQRKTSETARLSAEENRISAENDRVTAETARVNAENKRDSAEKSRVSAENGRVSAESARVTAESQRANAESSRAQNESARVSAETGRADAEADRVSAEDTRISAETARKTAETNRASAETVRESGEAARKSAETGRVSAETARANAESTRQTSEAARVSAEKSRVSAEAARSFADFFGKLGHFERAVIAQTPWCEAVDLEERIVYLTGAGVHDAAETAAERARAPGHGLERRYADARPVRAEREPLDCRNADAHAGKRARAVCDRESIDLGERNAAVCEQRLRHRQQGARVRQTAVLKGLCDELVVLGQSDRSAHRRGLQSENFHCFFTSSIVTTRSFSKVPY